MNPRPSTRRKPGPLLILLLLLWGGGVAGGLHSLWVYANTAGARGEAPARWPAVLGERPEGPALIVLLHPKCPCSRATVAELERIVARCGGRLDARVYFVEPPGAPPGWHETSLWNLVRRLDGIRTEVDAGGGVARRLGAETSGHAMLFGSDGRLWFSGGITAARAHEGDSRGKRAILDFAGPEGASAPDAGPPLETPVFGCPLFDPDSTL